MTVDKRSAKSKTSVRARPYDSRPSLTNEDDESHRKTAETAQLVNKDELEQVVNSRIDPATTLRHEHLPIIGSNRLGVSLSAELHLVFGEALK